MKMYSHLKMRRQRTEKETTEENVRETKSLHSSSSSFSSFFFILVYSCLRHINYRLLIRFSLSFSPFLALSVSRALILCTIVFMCLYVGLLVFFAYSHAFYFLFHTLASCRIRTILERSRACARTKSYSKQHSERK
jgi:hypothetical protein